MVLKFCSAHISAFVHRIFKILSTTYYIPPIMGGRHKNSKDRCIEAEIWAKQKFKTKVFLHTLYMKKSINIIQSQLWCSQSPKNLLTMKPCFWTVSHTFFGTVGKQIIVVTTPTPTQRNTISTQRLGWTRKWLCKPHHPTPPHHHPPQKLNSSLCEHQNNIHWLQLNIV